MTWQKVFTNFAFFVDHCVNIFCTSLWCLYDRHECFLTNGLHMGNLQMFSVMSISYYVALYSTKLWWIATQKCFDRRNICRLALCIFVVKYNFDRLVMDWTSKSFYHQCFMLYGKTSINTDIITLHYTICCRMPQCTCNSYCLQIDATSLFLLMIAQITVSGVKVTWWLLHSLVIYPAFWQLSRILCPTWQSFSSWLYKTTMITTSSVHSVMFVAKLIRQENLRPNKSWLYV